MTDDEVVALCDFVRVTERIRAQLVATKNIVEAVAEIAAVDEFLLPELTATLGHLHEAAEAMTRTVVALDARHGARWPNHDDTEGSG